MCGTLQGNFGLKTCRNFSVFTLILCIKQPSNSYGHVPTLDPAKPQNPWILLLQLLYHRYVLTPSDCMEPNFQNKLSLFNIPTDSPLSAYSVSLQTPLSRNQDLNDSSKLVRQKPQIVQPKPTEKKPVLWVLPPSCDSLY